MFQVAKLYMMSNCFDIAENIFMFENTKKYENLTVLEGVKINMFQNVSLYHIYME